MLTERIEAVLNRNLTQSPRARELCAQLSGKRVEIIMRSTPWKLAVESNGEALLLSKPVAGAEPGDASITGTPLSLLALAGATPEAVIQRGDVQIDGDVHLAQKFRELALLLRPDVEEELSRMVGDTPAFRMVSLARSALDWARRTANTGVQNVGEYLAHEKRDLVPRAEAAEFLQGVDKLREDVDRLAARIEKLDP
ncbi:MAG: SCP2 sterol-binding domain-containing protein [Steroidobacteraceae bacterium]